MLWKRFGRGTRVNPGEAVGIIQLNLLGSQNPIDNENFSYRRNCQGGSQSFIESSHSGKIKLLNSNLIQNSSKENIVMGRNMEILIEDEKGNQISGHKVSFGSKIYVKGDKIKSGQKFLNGTLYLTYYSRK